MNTSPLSLLTPKEFSGKNKIEKVAQQFAAILISQIFDEMQKNVVKSSLIPQSPAEKWYRQWLMEMYSQEAAKDNFKSLTNMIAAQLANNGYKK